MMRFNTFSGLTLATLLAGLAWTSLASAQPTDPLASAETARSVTIVTLGDSITKGVRGGVSAEQTFAALLESRLQQAGQAVRVVNVGIGGERTDQALQRLERVVELRPDIVTVMYGTNDSYVDTGQSTSRLTLNAYRDNLRKIVVELLRRGIVPVLMTEPRWSDDARPNGVGENPNLRLEPYLAACRETAQTWRVPLVDHFARWSEARAEGTNLRDWTTDGCHPNPAGHEQLADLLTPVIRHTLGPQLQARKKLLAGEPLRVVCFGDSVTGVYYHTGSRRAYTDMLGIALRQAVPAAQVELFNAGISGHTTVNALARLDRDVLAHQPDLVTVMFGLNDMTRVPLDEYRANLGQIVARCRAAGSEVVLATPNNVVTTGDRPTEKLIQYCDAVRDVGRELNVPVCDVYRELEAARAHDAFDWRLLMSDAIHPNMDGHKRMAAALAQTISGRRTSLEDTGPPRPLLPRTLERIGAGQPLRILAMPPYDTLFPAELGKPFPDAQVQVESWPVADLSLAQIEQAAQERVRQRQPDLVVIAVPRTAAAPSDETFAGSYAWIMNWSLNFGAPTWDVVVIHPSVAELETNSDAAPRDNLVRRLVRAQDLPLIDRMPGSQSDAAAIVREWLERLRAR